MKSWRTSWPAEPSEVSVRAVDECQVFVGIYGFRYGHTPVEGGPSITEMEYRRAREGGKRCLIYFADESLAAEARQRPGWEDEPEWKKERLKKFKAEIEKELVRAHGFKSDEELAGDIVEGLHLLITGYLPGYSHKDFLERWRKRSQEYADTFRGMQGLRQILATPPLYRHWRTFIHRRPWHALLRTKISDIFDAANNLDELSPFVNNFKDFNWERNYLNIQVDLQKRVMHEHIAIVSGLIKRLRKEQGEKLDFNELKSLRDLRSHIWDALREAEEPNFRRCFLVRGSIGSGKSHFIMSVLGETLPLAGNVYPSRPTYPLVLLLEPAKITAAESLDQFILRALNEFSGLQWMSLEEFNRFAEKQGEEQGEKENIKLIVAIDDIQK